MGQEVSVGLWRDWRSRPGRWVVRAPGQTVNTKAQGDFQVAVHMRAVARHGEES